MDKLGPASESVALIEADLTDEASVSSLVEGMPRVDAAIHLVGGFAMGPTAQFAVEDLRAQLDINVVTTFLVLKHALRKMQLEGYGRIVTVGSRSAVRPAAQQAAYSASKAAVVAMTQAIAEETRGRDITANCVLPSVIDTSANRASMGETKSDTWVKPASLAEVILFLASPAARDLRGAALPVYGSA
jgi:NAD(P)-dependent dehydrogenase (short-subunit alcohol dehydrogenase family)